MEEFLANVCTVEWNQRQDAGRPSLKRTRSRPKHPDKTHLIEAFGNRFEEMIRDRSKARSTSSPT